MRLTFFILFSIITLSGFSQDTTDYSSIDKKSRYVPPLVALRTKSLARNLTKSAKTDDEKLRAIYTWMTYHIKYDYKSLKNYNLKSQRNAWTLIRRKGVCSHYCSLFEELCEKANIKTYTIPGYTFKSIYSVNHEYYLADHVWTGVKTNTAYHLIDVTWGSGMAVPKKQYIQKFMFKHFGIAYTQKLKWKKMPNYKYFYTQAEQLAKSHLPLDSAWQLLEPTIKITDLYNIQYDTFQFPQGSAPNLDKARDLYLTTDLKDKIELPATIMFNSKNHFDPCQNQVNLAEHELKYLKWNNKTVEFNSQKLKYNKAIKHSKDATVNMNLFVRDNKYFHKQRRDTIKERRANIVGYANKHYRADAADKRYAYQNELKAKRLRKTLKLKYKAIYKQQEINTSYNPKWIKRPEAPKSLTKGVIRRMREDYTMIDIAENQHTIDSLNAELVKITDSVDYYKNLIYENEDRIVKINNKKTSACNLNTLLNIYSYSVIYITNRNESVSNVISDLDSIQRYNKFLISKNLKQAQAKEARICYLVISYEKKQIAKWRKVASLNSTAENEQQEIYNCLENINQVYVVLIKQLGGKIDFQKRQRKEWKINKKSFEKSIKADKIQRKVALYKENKDTKYEQKKEYVLNKHAIALGASATKIIRHSQTQLKKIKSIEEQREKQAQMLVKEK